MEHPLVKAVLGLITLIAPQTLLEQAYGPPQFQALQSSHKPVLDPCHGGDMQYPGLPLRDSPQIGLSRAV